jgi:hypothetical protein
MILSDRDIRAALEAGQLKIEPLGDNALQPSSVDVRIGNGFRVFQNNRYPYIDVRKPMEDLTDYVEVADGEPFILHPGEFVLGTTFETVSIPDHLVARLEGKSSLARLGLLIHSSLPGDEPVLFLSDGELRQRPIKEIVRKKLEGQVVSFDPETFEIRYADVTGWYEGPEDVIHDVVLASGRRIRVTAGHNLFTLDRDGALRKVRTGALQPGVEVAVAPRFAADLTADEHSLRGELKLDRVVEVRNTGRREAIFDLEVRPDGVPLENFLAGRNPVERPKAFRIHHFCILHLSIRRCAGS